MKSASELVELSTAHARTQFETITSQGKELSALFDRFVLRKSVTPIRSQAGRQRRAEQRGGDGARFGTDAERRAAQHVAHVDAEIVQRRRDHFGR